MSLALLKNRCTIRRVTSTNTNGNVVQTWSDLATDVKCLIQEKSGSVRQGKDGAGLLYDAVCFLPPGTDIRPRGTQDGQDQIYQTTPATGVVYLVKHIAERSGMGHHLSAYLERLRTT